MRRHAGPNGKYFTLCSTPIGWLGVVAGPAGLVEIVSRPQADEVRRRIAEHYPEALESAEGLCAAAAVQFEEYFSGQRRRFDLPLDFSGLTEFTREVLAALRRVPAGETVSYGELARQAGRPRAARAVGGAMAGNPFAIVVPCHRVIGAGGALVGFSGGRGVETKQWLLEFERRTARIAGAQG